MATKTQYYNLDKPSYDEVADIEVINANMDKIDTQMRNNADGVNFAKGISSDAYDNSRSYAVGDYCIYDNKLYRCINAIKSAEAFNVGKWEQTTVGNEVNQLNSNLVQLEFNELSGGKNLFKGDFFPTVLEFNENYTNRDLSKEMTPVKSIVGFKYAIFGAYLKKGTYTFSYTNNTFISLNRVAIAGTICGGSSEHIRKSFTWTQDVDGWTYFSIECDYNESEYNDTPFSITPNIQIEEGATATEYEPYIPSVKMLAEEISKQNDSLSVIGKCKNLLNPTLQTTTENGVTCTANGDGTYTLNGTASSQTTFVFAQLKSSNLFKNGITYKFCGCPKLNNNIWFVIEKNENPYTAYVTDYGNGGTFTYTSNDDTINIFVRMNEGIVLNNVILKPILTTNLSATYDDFVPYTGDGDTLTHDVAELKNDLGSKVNFDRLLYANVSCEADQWTVIDNSVNWFQLNVIPILKSAYQNSSGNQAGGLLRINANTGGIEFKPDSYCDWVLVYLLKV